MSDHVYIHDTRSTAAQLELPPREVMKLARTGKLLFKFARYAKNTSASRQTLTVTNENCSTAECGKADEAMTERKPQLGFAARETAPGAFKFQAVIYVAARSGGPMTKTLDPHGKLLSEQETRQLGYDTTRLVVKAREQRIGLPCFEWRHHAISYQDLW